jgi:hypothetical protein
MKEIYKDGVIPIKDNQEIYLDKVIGTMRIGTKITLKKK